MAMAIWHCLGISDPMTSKLNALKLNKESKLGKEWGKWNIARFADDRKLFYETE